MARMLSQPGGHCSWQVESLPAWLSFTWNLTGLVSNGFLFPVCFTPDLLLG